MCTPLASRAATKMGADSIVVMLTATRIETGDVAGVDGLCCAAANAAAARSGVQRIQRTAPDTCRQFASALAIASRSFGSSGVTSLGKNAVIRPCLSITYLEKFHAGRWPDWPRNAYTGDCSPPRFVTTFSNIGNVTS